MPVTRVFVDPGKRVNALSVWHGRDFYLVTYTPHSRRGMMLEVERHHPLFVLIECPVSYQLQQQKGDQNDLIAVAASAGAAAGACETTEFVQPSEWKKQLSKEIHHMRIAPRLTSLMHAQLATVAPSLRHNALDAIALAFWWFDRHPEAL